MPVNNKIVIRSSGVPQDIPLVSTLDNGELALNYNDGRLYYKNSTGNLKYFDVNPPVGMGWKDNVQQFSQAKGKGNTDPTWKDMGNGIYGMHFLPNNELFVNFHINHDYALGTLAYPHVHWLSDDIMLSGQSVVWQFSYVIAKGHQQGQSLLTTPSILQFSHIADGTEIIGEHMVSECDDNQAIDLLEPDTMIMGSVKLISTSIPGKVFGILADLHYLADRDHTPQKSPNFYTE